MQKLHAALSLSQQKWATAKMSRAEYAHRRRVKLLEVLAPDARCAECDEQHPIAELQVDHVDGCTWRKQNHNQWSRIARYWREFESGIPLRALCSSCNASDGQRFRGQRRYA